MEHRNAKFNQLYILVLLLLVGCYALVHSAVPSDVLTHVCSTQKDSWLRTEPLSVMKYEFFKRKSYPRGILKFSMVRLWFI